MIISLRITLNVRRLTYCLSIAYTIFEVKKNSLCVTKSIPGAFTGTLMPSNKNLKRNFKIYFLSYRVSHKFYLPPFLLKKNEYFVYYIGEWGLSWSDYLCF